MSRGPLPASERRRRNAPTIPTTRLPAGGRKGRAPKPPAGGELGERGRLWWKWAWSTPQAAAWSTGDLVVVARRASLEDDLRVLESTDSLDLGAIAAAETVAEVRVVVGHLAALATGRLGVMREMRELDDRLGLSPKARAALRWEIVPEAPAADGDDGDGDDEVGRRRAEREARLAAAVTT